MKTHRLARVAEAIREVASQTILLEMRDPRVKKEQVTVTHAEVFGDLQHAKVYVSIMGSPREQQLCLYGLQHAAGFIQSKLASRLQTRFTPSIRFVVDDGVKKSLEMTRLINEALGETQGDAPPVVEDSPDDNAPDAPEAGAADGTAEEEPAD